MMTTTMTKRSSATGRTTAAATITMIDQTMRPLLMVTVFPVHFTRAE
jgi:hypothetical protein